MTEDDLSREPTRGAASTLREYARGRLKGLDHRDIAPEAGVIDDADMRELLIFARQAWRSQRGAGDPDFEETKWYKNRREVAASETATEAVHEGKLAVMDYLTGRPEWEPDVRGLHAIHRLENWLVYSEAAKVAYIAGHMGSGKTDFAHLCAEVIEHRCSVDQDLPDAEIRSNIPSSEYNSITRYPRFKDWVEEGSVGEQRWFVFDEASSQLSGYSHDREEVEKLMSSLVKKARKNGVNLLIIGHTGMDLHADLRRLADYVEKPSKKTARFYATVKRGEGSGHLFDLDRLPPSRKDFDTEDEAPWDWGDALDETGDDTLDPSDVQRLIAKRAAEIYESTEMSQNDVVEMLNSAADDGVSISRNHLRSARDGEYQEVRIV